MEPRFVIVFWHLVPAYECVFNVIPQRTFYFIGIESFPRLKHHIRHILANSGILENVMMIF